MSIFNFTVGYQIWTNDWLPAEHSQLFEVMLKNTGYNSVPWKDCSLEIRICSDL